MTNKKLEDLVPPLDLCKRIPAGKFAESVLVYYRRGNQTVLLERKDLLKEFPDFDKFPDVLVCPAPLPTEIFKALPACTYYRWGDEWTVALCNDTLDNVVKDRNPAAAALRLWLDVEGVEI